MRLLSDSVMWTILPTVNPWAHTHRWALRRAQLHRNVLRKRIGELRKRFGRTRSVGIILTEHAGDIVASEPISRFIRRTSPDSLVVWVVNAKYKEIVHAFDAVDEVYPVGCLIEAMYLQEGVFDETHNCHFHDRWCATCGMGLPNLKADPDVNAENYYEYGPLLKVLQRVGSLPMVNDSPHLVISPQVHRRISEKLLHIEDFVAIHASSNEADRNWKPEKWEQLARLIRDRFNLSTVEVGSMSGMDHRLGISENLCGHLTWLETAEVIRRSKLFIGVDSGPAHLANAVGVPGVIIMGKYRKFTQHVPYTGGYSDGSRGTIVRALGPASDVTVNAVFESAVVRLGARVCNDP